MATKIQLRRDLSSNWASTNPVLAQGEPGVELDTNNMKIGDGVKAWNDLAYTVQESGLQSVFVNVNDYYSQVARISEDGIHWTAPVQTGSIGAQQSMDWYSNSIAIGNGVIVYRAYNNILDRDELRYSTGPYQAAIVPNDDITRRGPNGEDITWESLDFGGGYFIAGGYYHDADVNTNRPIAAYSADGATWTKVDIDLAYVNGIVVAQNNHSAGTATGMTISSVTRGANGWLFSLNYQNNTTNPNGSDRLNPGAFYITSITTPLNSSSYFATMPASSWHSWFDGHGWISYYNTANIYVNSSADPRQGSWNDLLLSTAINNLNLSHSDYYGVEDIAAGEIDGVNYMAISDYYGVVYYTPDQGTTWNYVTPGPAYASIYRIAIGTQGGIYLGPNGTGNQIVWGQAPLSSWYGERVTISGSYVVELNGTWFMDNYDSNWGLYHDKAKTNRLDTSAFASYTTISKSAVHGKKGDNTLVLPDLNYIVVGQRVYAGTDNYNGQNHSQPQDRTYWLMTDEDREESWYEPNIVVAKNTDNNSITLKYPIYETFDNETVHFQALVKYTHGDEIRNLIYGGGKFVGTGNNSSRAYVTANMTDWVHTPFAQYQGGFSNGNFAYGALDINKNALRNDSKVVPSVTNSLTLGDTFNVNIVNTVDRYDLTFRDGPGGPSDYYGIGATSYNEGFININPTDALWSIGVHDKWRGGPNGGTVAIGSYTGRRQGGGVDIENSNIDTGYDEYYHARSVAVTTANNKFWFDDYYGSFIAPKIAIGNSNNYYDYYYGYNHIGDIHFETNSGSPWQSDLYVTEGYDLNIYSMFAPIESGGGVYIHWDDTNKISLNGDGVTIHASSDYQWQFTSDNNGTLYAPNWYGAGSDIDMGGYWAIGQRHGNAGYPYIGATDNVDPDPYDFVIQAGHANRPGSSTYNYWYFNRDGSLQLPPSGHINVGGFWQIGSGCVNIQATDVVSMGDAYDLQITANSQYWYFQQDGKFKLPSGGDIVDSNGHSVLNQDIPQHAVSANGDYTIALSDRGKHIYKTGTGSIYIPTNAAVAFPIGTCITLVTGTGQSTTITPVDSGTTTLVLSKFGTDNEINIPADTYVTILKIETDKWIVQT